MKQLKIKHIAVDFSAAKNKKNRSPLLFVHGAAGTSKIYKNYLQFFSDAGWDCYAVNLRGHSPSDSDPNLAMISIEEYADDVQMVCSECSIQDAVIIGHSMGGVVAQKAAEAMEKISAMVLINSGPVNGVRMQLRGGFKTFMMAIRSIKATIKKMAITPSFKIAKQTVLGHLPESQKEQVFNYLVAESMVATNQVGRSMVKVNPGKITCPKLVISCNQDAMVKPAMQNKIAEYHTAELKSYDNYAHLPMLEPGWEVLAKDLETWLQSKL